MNKFNLNHTNPDLSHLKELNRKPILGIDLDGVLSDTRKQFLKEIESRYNINLKSGTRSIKSKTGKNFGTLINEIVNEDISIYDKVKPINGSSEATNKLKEYYTIKIITHRVSVKWMEEQSQREQMKEQSIKWLNDNNIYFDEFVYPTPDNKSKVDADIYIDDRKQNIYNFVQNNKIGIMYIRPHNINSLLWDSWLASSEIGEDVIYISNNEELQWNVITESLIKEMKN